MAEVKISELSELTTPQDDDVILINEESGGTYTTKAITYANLVPHRYLLIRVLGEEEALTIGDGKMTIPFPFSCILEDVNIAVHTPSTSGLPTVQLHNLDYSGGAHDMLTAVGKVSIDEDEYSSFTATTPPVIDTSYDDISAGDRIRVDVDIAGTDTEGLDLILEVSLT